MTKHGIDFKTMLVLRNHIKRVVEDCITKKEALSCSDIKLGLVMLLDENIDTDLLHKVSSLTMCFGFLHRMEMLMTQKKDLMIDKSKKGGVSTKNQSQDERT